MSRRQEPPAVEELDRALREVRFAPRSSLGPELLGRIRRGERSKGAVRPRRIRSGLLALAAAALAGSAVAILLLGHSSIRHQAPSRASGGDWSFTVDRCCFDLDGGGRADDGIRLVTEGDSQVRQLWVYEDRDGSHGYTPADLLRLDRGRVPTLADTRWRKLVTRSHCCLDFDGSGRADGGVLILGVPPDRIVMASLYERPGAGGPAPADVSLR